MQNTSLRINQRLPNKVGDTVIRLGFYILSNRLTAC